MKYLLIAMLSILPGCVTNLAWRGVVNNYHQKATTQGMVSNWPDVGDTSIAADKQFDADAAVSTDSGSATNTPTSGDMETGGRINNQPKSGSSSVAAEKTTDATLDLPLK